VSLCSLGANRPHLTHPQPHKHTPNTLYLLFFFCFFLCLDNCLGLYVCLVVWVWGGLTSVVDRARLNTRTDTETHLMMAWHGIARPETDPGPVN
jgi:hypothetical protein